jgi:hypothetical protein
MTSREFIRFLLLCCAGSGLIFALTMPSFPVKPSTASLAFWRKGALKLFSSDPEDRSSADRLRKIEETLADIVQIQLNSSLSQAKTERQLFELIGYNKNRDIELESVISSYFHLTLLNEGWNVTRVKVKDIYSLEGRLLTDWDGAFFGTRSDMELPIFFIVESKQLN